MTAPELYAEATRRGLQLEPRGDKLAVSPPDRLDPDFRDMLVAHKAEVLAWLAAREAGLPEVQDQWVNVAWQVLNGEWQGGTQSEWEAVEMGLRCIDHPVCKAALAVCRQSLAAFKKRRTNL